MKKSTKLRLVGGVILLFNLWLVGRYDIQGMSVLLLTFGFAVGFECLVVRPAAREANKSDVPVADNFVTPNRTQL